ncbi:MAG: PepSY domain-containing protein [Hansschlegelia sp.]
MTRFSAIAASLALGAATLALPTAGYAADETEMAMNAKVTISQAVEAAEAKGGKATEVEFDDDYGGRWEVKVLAEGGDKLTTYFVDPTSGQVTGEEPQTFEKYFTMLKPEAFQKAQTQLKAAIALAEAAGSGKAVSAEVERSGDAVSYEIEVAQADRSTKDVDVDASGKAVID